MFVDGADRIDDIFGEDGSNLFAVAVGVIEREDCANMLLVVDGSDCFVGLFSTDPLTVFCLEEDVRLRGWAAAENMEGDGLLGCLSSVVGVCAWDANIGFEGSAACALAGELKLNRELGCAEASLDGLKDVF